MKVSYAHICDYALVADGKLSVMGIFDRINTLHLPWVHPTAFLAFEVVFEPAEVGKETTIRIEIRDQDGGVVFEADGRWGSEGKAKIGDRPTLKQVLQFNNLTFHKKGPHEVVIWLQGRLAATIPFTVER